MLTTAYQIQGLRLCDTQFSHLEGARSAVIQYFISHCDLILEPALDHGPVPGQSFSGGLSGRCLSLLRLKALTLSHLSSQSPKD